MKVIFRADDVGYTDVHNIGTFKAIDEGVVTACDIMLDTPGFPDAARRLRNYPWISLGWHTHFWGRPVLDPKEVPSMVDENGRFKWRKNKKAVMEVDYEEAVRECRAQIENCRRLLGRIPDTGQGDDFSPLGRAIQTVCDEYGIIGHFTSGKGYGNREIVADEKWRHLNIQEWVDHSGKHHKSLNVVDFPFYDPAGAIMEMPVDDSIIWLRSQHPGYLDDYVLAESSCTIPRVKDVEAYTSATLKNWIKENRIELVNTRDALFGTNEYQEHLKEINSDLWKGNWE